MKSIPTRIGVKFAQIEEASSKILSSCIEYLKSPNDRNLEVIGSYLGSVASDLRAALDYATWHFAESKLKSKLSAREYKDLEWQHNFPLEKERRYFDRSLIVKYATEHAKDVYRFLESAQPFSDNQNAWLWQLRRISNIDRHTMPVEVMNLNPTAFELVGSRFRAAAFGDSVIAFGEDGSVSLTKVPCYVKPYGAFATQGGKWVVFLLNLDGEKLGLVKWLQMATSGANQLVLRFCNLL